MTISYIVFFRDAKKQNTFRLVNKIRLTPKSPDALASARRAKSTAAAVEAAKSSAQ